MKLKITIAFSSIIFLVLIIYSGCGQSTPKNEELAAVTKHIADEYQNNLRGKLMAALDDTTISTAGAIFVCSEIAPDISARYTSLPGVTVKRTSAKLRNPDNAPDEYEARILDTLAARPAFASQDHYGWQDDGDKKSFRYVTGIKISSMCLKCHGNPEKMEEDVKEAIAERYAVDQATGYHLGDLRGILSVTLEWPEASAVYDSIKGAL
jgi:hypothetical protein